MAHEILDGALVSELTAWDLKVLRALPAWPDLSGLKNAERASAWQIAEAVREYDVQYVCATLRGLADRRLAASSYGTARRPQRWLRSREGDEYLEALQ
jgi:hypothetical protein